MLLLYVFGWVLNIGQVREEIDLIFLKNIRCFLYILATLLTISLQFTEICLGLWFDEFTEMLISFMIVNKAVAILVLPSEIFKLRRVGQSSPSLVNSRMSYLLILADV